MSKKDLVVRDEFNVSEVPEYLSGGESIGLDNLNQEDLIPPRLLLLQGSSVAVEEGLGRSGDMFNSVTEEVYEQPLRCIPVYVGKSKVKWLDSVGLECMSNDCKTGTVYGECRTCKFNNRVNGFPECNDVLYYIMYLIDTKEYVILSGSRTNLTPLRKIASFLKSKRLPLWAMVWSLTSKNKANKNGKTSKIWNPVMAGWADKDTAAALEAKYKEFSSVATQVSEAVTASEDGKGTVEENTDMPF